MLESQAQSKILKWLQSVPGLFVFKTISCNKRGIPDIIVCYRGQFIAFEVKRNSKCKASTLQLFQMKQIELAGGKSYIVSSLDEVKNILLSKCDRKAMDLKSSKNES